MKIVFGADHRGFRLKSDLIRFVKELGHDILDMGTFSEESVDYPDFALKAAREVISKRADLGVLICRTGIGMSISANKINGIRAALCYSEEVAKLCRQDNDANVLCLGEDLGDLETIKRIFKTWLETGFTGERHQRRLDKIRKLEGGKIEI